jgi:probable rRNA maturation factor
MDLSVKKIECVTVKNDQRTYGLDLKKIKNIATEISCKLGINHYETCITFVTPRKMKEFNSQFRGKDSSTDVLSFPQYQWKRPLKVRKNPPQKRPLLNPMPLGDILISAKDAEENAQRVGTTLDREICFLVVHGILHLVGHDHMEPKGKKIMFDEQTKLMRAFARSSGKDPAWKRCAWKKQSRKNKN